MKLEQHLSQIAELNQEAMKEAKSRWDHVAKPLNSLGLLEDAVVQIAGIQGTSQISVEKKALIIMCADHGVVEEGVTQTGQEVTAIVTENFASGNSCVCIMAERANVMVFPVDIGVARDLKHTDGKYPVQVQKIAYGTRNFCKEPAMTRREAREAIEVGIRMAGKLKKEGYEILATGEMGIGNTTASSAVASVLLGMEPSVLTGKGAGLSDEGLKKKIQVIEEAISRHRPDWEDGLDVLSKVGGLDLAGLTGVFLGGAIYRIPVVIDGFISSVAALTAVSLCPEAKSYMMASHVSSEPAGKMVLDALGKHAMIQGCLCLGEGTGAVAAMPLLDMAADVYRRMSTFQENQIEDYQPL